MPKWWKLIKENKINIVIQINGKKRALLDAEPDQSEEKIFNECLEIENIKNLVSGKNIIKKIYVKNKLVNIVIKWKCLNSFIFLLLYFF